MDGDRRADAGMMRDGKMAEWIDTWEVLGASVGRGVGEESGKGPMVTPPGRGSHLEGFSSITLIPAFQGLSGTQPEQLAVRAHVGSVEGCPVRV